MKEDRKKILLNKYNINIDDIDKNMLRDSFKRIIDRNKKIIDINEEKIGLLKELNNDISNYLDRK